MKEVERLKMVEKEITLTIIKLTEEESSMLTPEEQARLIRFLLALRLDVRAQIAEKEHGKK